MIDHLRNTQSVGLEDLAVLVLDEADRLLEMGFAEEVRARRRRREPGQQPCPCPAAAGRPCHVVAGAG